MRISDKELRILRLALGDYILEQDGGGTVSQDEIDTAEKLWQKLGREIIKRLERVSA